MSRLVVLLAGLAIEHPCGWIELDYFYAKKFNNKNGRRITLARWMETFRPKCKAVRVAIVRIDAQPAKSKGAP